MTQSQNIEELQKLAETVSVKTMYTFNISYDRHKLRYGYRTSLFPASYMPNQSSLEYARDPDWYYKIGTKRLKLKRAIFLLTATFFIVRWRVAQVEEFDRLKRIE